MKRRSAFLMMSLIAVAAVASAGGPVTDIQDPEWSMVEVGVYEHVDENGIVIRRTEGVEGLQWDISRLEQILEMIAGAPDMSPEQRNEKLNLVSNQLTRLYEILELNPRSAADKRITPNIFARPLCHWVRATTTPYSCAGCHGALARAHFDNTGCPGVIAEGYVFAYANGEATGVYTAYDSANWSDAFDISAHAMGVYHICDYGSATVVRYNGDYHYSNATYEMDPDCYSCPTCS